MFRVLFIRRLDGCLEAGENDFDIAEPALNNHLTLPDIGLSLRSHCLLAARPPRVIENVFPVSRRFTREREGEHVTQQLAARALSYSAFVTSRDLDWGKIYCHRSSVCLRVHASRAG